MKVLSGLIVIVITMVLGAPSRAGDEPVTFDALITSDHAVYYPDEKVDLTFWVKGDPGSVTPDLRVIDPTGAALPPKKIDGRGFSETKGRGLDGRERTPAIHDGRHYSERIDDLHKWYEFSKSGTYEVRLTAQRVAPEGEQVEEISNSLRIEILQKPLATDRMIPVSDIWALDMPGTKPMIVRLSGRPLRHSAPEGPLVADMLLALHQELGPTESARSCFVVNNGALSGLAEAKQVLVEGRLRRSSIAGTGNACAVFFSRPFGWYVHLTSAELRGQVLQLTYRLVPHETKEMTSHLALVPLSALPIGQLRIDVKPEIDAGWSRVAMGEWIDRVICRSTNVDVRP